MARHTTANLTASRRASGHARSKQTRPAAVIVAATLAAHPGRTATELAQLADLGASTVTKALAALEKDGRASRHIPEDTDSRGRRAAARWQPVPTTPPADEQPVALRHRPTTKTRTSKAPTSTARPAGRRSAHEVTLGLTAGGTAPTQTGRLGKGELGTLVLEYLLAHTGEDVGPTAIGKALARSQGAVANCLTKLATSGDIVQTSNKPRRYRLAS